jgi:hypothetical protein
MATFIVPPRDTAQIRKFRHAADEDNALARHVTRA